MKSGTYKVSELKKIMAESSSEFKPKFGDGVESSNKTEAGKAYKDAKKRVKDFDGGGKEDYWKGDAKYTKEDYNGTTLDYNPETADEKFKKRVHAQVKGYSSEAEMNNGIEKDGDYSDNENIYQGIKKSGQEKHKRIEDTKKTGLQASKMPDGTFKKEEMYESKDGFDMRQMINTINKKVNSINEEHINEMNGNDYIERLEQLIDDGLVDPDDEETCIRVLSGDDSGFRKEENDDIFSDYDGEEELNEEKKPIKTVLFKKTEFVNEDYMRSRIPDDFKKNGCKFKMKDRAENTYLLEWRNGKAVVLEHTNKAGLVESLNRMGQLVNYKSDVNVTDRQIRLNEDSNLNKTLNRVRDLMK